MSNQNQKPIYVGSGVEKFDGDLVEISVCLSDIPAEHRFEYNGKWYAKLKINTWKPDATKKVDAEIAPPAENVDLPF
jgi:hypothetical protein